MDIEKISDILGYNDLKMNNYLNDKLKCLYPDIDLNNIDNDLLENIIQNIVTNDYKNIDKIKNEMFTNIQNISNVSNNIDKKINTNNYKNEFDMEIIKQNILMADEIIPEMSISSNLIYLKGKLNGIDTKIMMKKYEQQIIILTILEIEDELLYKNLLIMNFKSYLQSTLKLLTSFEHLLV